MPMTAARLSMLLLVLPLCAPAATAQMFTYGADRDGPTQAVSVGYFGVDFRYDGSGTPLTRFDFTAPAYGVVYTRPNMFSSFAIGSQEQGNNTLQLIDFSLSTWGGLTIPGMSQEGRVRLYVPVVLHSDYRRVRYDDREAVDLEDFTFTVLGLGAGLGLRARLGAGARLEARATPALGLAIRSFGDAIGRADIVEADVLLHLGEVFKAVGLTAGFSYRLQVWNIRASNLFTIIDNEVFDYRDQRPVFHVGLNW